MTTRSDRRESPGEASARVDQSFIAGVGLAGASLAIAAISFIVLVGAVSFDVWPKADDESAGPVAELAPDTTGPESSDQSAAPLDGALFAGIVPADVTGVAPTGGGGGSGGGGGDGNGGGGGDDDGGASQGGGPDPNELPEPVPAPESVGTPGAGGDDEGKTGAGTPAAKKGLPVVGDVGGDELNEEGDEKSGPGEGGDEDADEENDRPRQGARRSGSSPGGKAAGGIGASSRDADTDFLGGGKLDGGRAPRYPRGSSSR